MLRAAVLVCLATTAGCSCGDDGAGLLVNLRTDLVPDVEFQLVRVEVFAGAMAAGTPVRVEDAAVLATYDYFVARRIAEFETVPKGEVMVRVRLLDAREEVVAERLVRVDLEERTLITVLITRDCRGVMCPEAGDSADAITCLGGRCIDPDCLDGTEPSCRSECSDDDACEVIAACAEARCVIGVCVAETDDMLCGMGEYCDPERGCRSRPGSVDGGLGDGGGADGGVDAGPDAGCSGSSCDDGDACNGVEECIEGVCSPGTPMVCDDGVACTTDACLAGVCSSTPNDDMCTAAAGGRCDPATGCQYPVCTAMTCTADPCQTATCMGATCMRTMLCTMGQMCCGDACVPAGCDDGNPCTDDACGPSGCTHAFNTVPCTDGSLCTTGDRCSGGACVGGAAPMCADGNPCTDDSCSPATGCVHANNGDACDDGMYCTVTDRCAAGACSGSGIPCGAPTPSCDEASDTCFSCRSDGDCPAMEQGPWSGCDYSDVCDESASEHRDLTTYRCSAGTCAPTVTPEMRSCSRSTAMVMCAPTEIGPWGPCESLGGICDAAGNQRRTLTTHSCQSGVCDTFIGGEAAFCERMTDGLDCDDGLVCNGFSTCSGGACAPGAAPCAGECVTCVEGSGCQLAADGSPCSADGCWMGSCLDCSPCIAPNCAISAEPGCDFGSGCMPCGRLAT